MLKAKDIHGTEAYRQLREAVVKAVPAALRRTQLALLTRRFLTRLNEQGMDIRLDPDRLTVHSAMIWADTAEGHVFWSIINGGGIVAGFNLNPCPIKKPKPRVRAERPGAAARRHILAVDDLLRRPLAGAQLAPHPWPPELPHGAVEIRAEEVNPAPAAKKIGWW